MIVHKTEPILLVGAGSLPDGLWHEATALAPHIVAVDGGLRHVLNHAGEADAVIGDLDSIGAYAQQVPRDRLHRIAEQDSTDFDKALRNVAAPLVIAVGFSGPQVDHQLAVYSSLMQRPERPCVVVGESDLVLLAPPRFTAALPHGMRFSLYPMGRVRGRSDGLRWPIEGIEFDPMGRIGTSNQVGDGKAAAQDGQEVQVTVEVDAPRMLLILPRAALPLLPSALLGSARAPDVGQWSVRA